jgi:hypothetical protein
MSEYVDKGLVEYEGVFMIVLPLVTFDGGEARHSGSFCCFVLQETPSPGPPSKPGSWTLTPVVGEDDRPCRFASFGEAVKQGFEQTDFRRTGIVFPP